MELTKKEVKSILVASLIIAVVFGFNDKSESFDIVYWLLNFGFVFLGALISTLLYTFAIKWGARHYGGKATYHIWSIKQYFIRQQMKFEPPIPIGVVIGLLVTLFSFGKVYLLAIHAPVIESHKVAKSGRLFKNIYETEMAKAHSFGPLTLLILGLLLQVINPELFSTLITMNYLLAIYHLIPVSELNGTHIFFGGKIYYIFLVILTLACVIFAQFLSPILAAFIALAIALVIALIILFSVLA
jgi:hypothetical protein